MRQGSLCLCIQLVIHTWLHKQKPLERIAFVIIWSGLKALSSISNSFTYSRHHMMLYFFFLTKKQQIETSWLNVDPTLKNKFSQAGSWTFNLGPQGTPYEPHTIWGGLGWEREWLVEGHPVNFIVQCTHLFWMLVWPLTTMPHVASILDVTWWFRT